MAFSCLPVKLKALSKTNVSFETTCVTLTWFELALLTQIVFPKYVNINIDSSAAMLSNRRAVTRLQEVSAVAGILGNNQGRIPNRFLLRWLSQSLLPSGTTLTVK